jgi:hypothetical protein
MIAAAIRVSLCLVALGVAGAQAQVVPATPRKFTTRSMTNSGAGGASISTNGGGISIGPGAAAAATKVRYTTHIALSDSRQWKSSDGKSLLGKLIAFEDLTAETEKGAPPPTFTPPANPTVVKDGKARLLVDSRPYELPLDRLSESDREFVEKIRAAAAPKAAAPATQGAAK